jgi:hypothetical protein
MKMSSYFIMLFILIISGCSRTYYRHQADREALGLIRQNTQHEQWKLEQYRLQPYKNSRLYDEQPADCPPMPCDDPTAHEYMHCVDGKKGYPRWHENGETDQRSNPFWLARLPRNERGEMVLTANEAVKQGFLHSPNYQREMEEVYLSALDVSFERFRFDTQFFAGYSAQYTADGPKRSGGGGESSSEFELGTFPASRGIRAQKLYTTGAETVVGFANSLVWQFAGPDDYQGNTLIDFAITQPLLRNAGRDRVMERLTRSERTLLYNVRSMERYRQAYYVQILTGRDPGQGPSRSGGVFGGSGLDGFSGVGGGGFGRVSTAAAGAGASGSGAAGAGAQQAGGYLGLLQQQQEIRNQEDNIARLDNNTALLGIYLEAAKEKRTTPEDVLGLELQVAQAKQALLNAQSRLLNSRNALEVQLDTFKGVLGLPPHLCVVVDDNLLQDFELIDANLNDQQARVQELREEIGGINQNIMSYVYEEGQDPLGNPIRKLRWSQELAQQLSALKKQFVPAEKIYRLASEQSFPEVKANHEAVVNAVPERTQYLKHLQATYQQDKNNLCSLLPMGKLEPKIFDLERLASLPNILSQKIGNLETDFAVYPTRFEQWKTSLATLEEAAENLDDETRFANLRGNVLLFGQEVLTRLQLDILSLQLLQARARIESAQLAKVNLKAEEALEVARQYRHDWMNARAAVVDQWRLIEFNADNLEGSLDVIFSGDVANSGQNPFNLQSTTGRLRAGIRFDSPLTRLSERNVYRQVLIEYQQARRNYYLFEDSIARGLRTQLRTIAVNQINFELQRLAVAQAAEQIFFNDENRKRMEETRKTTSNTAARDAVSALSDLLDAQNNFLSVYVNYEVLRRQLDLDLGTMQLDKNGVWLDPGTIGNSEEMQLETFTEPEELPLTDAQINLMVENIDTQNAEANAIQQVNYETEQPLPKKPLQLRK